MSRFEEGLKNLLWKFRGRGEWYFVPSEVRAWLVSIRNIEALLSTGNDEEQAPIATPDPIPEDVKAAWLTAMGHLIISPRSTVWHQPGTVQEGRLLTKCGLELTPDNYWRLLEKKNVRLTFRHRICEICDPETAQKEQ